MAENDLDYRAECEAVRVALEQLMAPYRVIQKVLMEIAQIEFSPEGARDLTARLRIMKSDIERNMGSVEARAAVITGRAEIERMLSAKAWRSRPEP